MKRMAALLLTIIITFGFMALGEEDFCGLWIPFDEEGTLFIEQDDFSGQFILVDKNGEEANDHSFRAYKDSNYENILHIFYDDVNGYLDVSGRWIAKPQFEYAGSFQENGLAVVGKDRLWGLINLNGEYVFEPQFDQNYKYSIIFYNHVARVMKDGLYGYIRDDGMFLFEPQFEEAYDFDGDIYAIIGENGKEGYVNRNGEIVISPRFDKAFGFSGDYALVKQDGLYGYIDRDGYIVVEPSFIKASEEIYNGIAAVSVDGKLRGYIKMDGEYLFEPQFDRAEPFIYGVAAVEMPEDAWTVYKPRTGLVDTEGNFLLAPEYWMISLYRDGFQYRFCDGFFSKWVSIRQEEEGLDPVEYDLIIIAYRDYKEVQNFTFIDGVFTEIPVLRVYDFDMEF